MAGSQGSAEGQSRSGESRVDPGFLYLRAPGHQTVQVHVFPEDRRLTADIARTAADIGADGEPDLAAWRASLEERLRTWYPRLVIHPRAELAAIMPSEEVWYVMRDGRIRSRGDRTDRLHAALATARDMTAQAGEALGRSQEVAAEMRDRLAVGRHAEPSAPDTTSDAIDADPDLVDATEDAEDREVRTVPDRG